MSRFWIVPIVTTLALSACASPQARIADKLVDYGFDRQAATCVGKELEERLTNRQLRTLANLAGDISREGRDVGEMSIGELANRVRRTGDPELLAVLTRAGIGCSVLG